LIGPTCEYHCISSGGGSHSLSDIVSGIKAKVGKNEQGFLGGEGCWDRGTGGERGKKTRRMKMASTRLEKKKRERSRRINIVPVQLRGKTFSATTFELGKGDPRGQQRIEKQISTGLTQDLGREKGEKTDGKACPCEVFKSGRSLALGQLISGSSLGGRGET